ncbi:5-aminolevulinate synthase, erythroid-specific, mitochondrial [Echinococcus granulosus]|nr:5-aminolevulinate synthase, erythroid-specific, mitochondrial [Echinococcus granulosus]
MFAASVDTECCYADGLTFTTSLPPLVLAVVRASVAILKSAKGRDLRAEQRRCASLVLRRLQEVDLSVVNICLHIFTFVGNAGVCTSISGALLFNHQIYLQSINYPTVAKGSELLCLTPSSSTPTQ